MAPDGGLLLPETVPDVRAELAAWRALPYTALAQAVMGPFTDLDDGTLGDLLRRSYASFRHPEVTPVVPVGDVHVLELFHGPTLAFKDVALQLLGNLFSHLLRETGGSLNILGATSGDTGSAAIHGVRGRDRIRIFVMHPHGRVSPVQERQMTTVTDANVFNMAVEGTFDDCQRIMKTLFADTAFKARYALGSVNSINWARILAQIVYYFYGAFRVMDATGAERVQFSVPTGNFGDVFAGYLAVRMGLPVSRLILATNENDILARYFKTGIYRCGEVAATLSPSMDIQVASNFERYLYYRAGEDPSRVCAWMRTFAASGELDLSGEPAADASSSCLCAGAGDTQATLETIREYDARHGYLLDPHTAVGVAVGRRLRAAGEPLICLATAHPAKFGDAIGRALGRDAAHHPLIDALRDLPTRCEVLPNDVETVRGYLRTALGEGEDEDGR
jgi:threonine synthase